MNIYYCCRDFMGYKLDAVVSSKDKEAAIKLLDWEIDEDTTNIETIEIGMTGLKIEKVWCEESL